MGFVEKVKNVISKLRAAGKTEKRCLKSSNRQQRQQRS